MYCYSIYTIDIWSILTINNPALIYMCYLCFYHTLILQLRDLRVGQ